MAPHDYDYCIIVDFMNLNLITVYMYLTLDVSHYRQGVSRGCERYGVTCVAWRHYVAYSTGWSRVSCWFSWGLTSTSLTPPSLGIQGTFNTYWWSFKFSELSSEANLWLQTAFIRYYTLHKRVSFLFILIITVHKSTFYIQFCQSDYSLLEHSVPTPKCLD